LNAGFQHCRLAAEEESMTNPKRRFLLLGVLALGLGAFSSFQVYEKLRVEVSRSKGNVEVVIAARDIQVGDKIRDLDLKVVEYPSEHLPDGVFRTNTPVLGRAAILPIRKGEFVLADKVAGGKVDGGLSPLIAPGMRAVAVRVNDVTSVNGFAVPGSRVDVLVVGNVTETGERSALTLLQDVAVLTNGQKVERSAAGEPQSGTVVTLLVSPEDAEKLALASQEAHIQLFLRNQLDSMREKPVTINRRTLLGEPSKPAVRLIRTKHAAKETTPSPKIEVEVFRGPQKETIPFKQ
jgi:pilus assembly protein CpaB